MNDDVRMENCMEGQRLNVLALSALECARGKRNLSRAELAGRLGVKESRVDEVLDGEVRMTLGTFAKFGLACGVRWHFFGSEASDSSEVVVAPEAGRDFFKKTPPSPL